MKSLGRIGLVVARSTQIESPVFESYTGITCSSLGTRNESPRIHSTTSSLYYHFNRIKHLTTIVFICIKFCTKLLFLRDLLMVLQYHNSLCSCVLTLSKPKVLSISHMSRARPTCTSMQSGQAIYVYSST